LNFIQQKSDQYEEIVLTPESTTLDKVNYYIFHLKSLLKTSDQQHVSTVSDFDDALLQFSSFISNGRSNIFFENVIWFIYLKIEYSTKISNSSDTSTAIVGNPDGIYAATIWFLWYCCRRELQKLFDTNIPAALSRVILKTIIYLK